MANEKMEKLKAMKKDNMVSKEELHEVAGGSTDFGDGYSGWANSSRFMNVLLGGDVCDRYGDWTVDSHRREIISAWRKVGVTIREGNRGELTYIVGYNRYTPREAFQYAMHKAGKKLEPKDWCW